METLQVESCVWGHHIYKRIWHPTVGEELNYMRETTNSKDPYTVAVMRNSTVVGHVPRKMSSACALFLRCKLPHTRMRFLELCMWVLQNTCTSCSIIGEIKYGRCFAIRKTAKLKSLPNFPTIR